MKFDRRSFATEVRSSKDGRKIEGYAATFNQRTQLPGFIERILPGAFTRAVQEKQDVVCLFNHNENFVLGRTTSGTLRLAQDSRGLHYVCDLPDTQVARDLHASIQRGDINGCSFAFTMVPGGEAWTEESGDCGRYVLRSISDLNLHDVSPVVNPQYTNTEVSARELEIVGAELGSRRSHRTLTPAEERELQRAFNKKIADIRSSAIEEAQEDIAHTDRRRKLLFS
jgi:uncharacterized protein